MPLYDYKCEACGHLLEQFQRMKEVPLKKCPLCRKSQLRRLIGCPAIRTDTTFNAGLGTLRSHFKDESELYRVVAAAKKRGYTPRATDSYQPMMADGCGDPAAFVPHDNPKSHVRKVGKARDVSYHGAVEVERKPKG